MTPLPLEAEDGLCLVGLGPCRPFAVLLPRCYHKARSSRISADLASVVGLVVTAS
jgi:hypothetical protein